MDDADLTQERMEIEMALRIRVRKPAPVFIGECHNCGETARSPIALFCDSDCRDDWQKRQKNRP